MSRLSAALSKLSESAIIETGASGNFEYIKYADNKAEVWGYQNVAADAGTQWISGQPFYYQDVDVTLPSGVFGTTPQEIIAISGNTQWWVFGAWGTASNKIRVRLVKIAASAQAAIIRVHVRGTAS